MARNSDLVAVLEYLDRKTSFKPPKMGRKTNKMPKLPTEFDVIAYVQKKEDEVERWKKFLKDKEKLDKKEEKKDEKKRQFIGIEWYVIGLLSYPLVGYISNLPVLK